MQNPPRDKVIIAQQRAEAARRRRAERHTVQASKGEARLIAQATGTDHDESGYHERDPRNFDQTGGRYAILEPAAHRPISSREAAGLNQAFANIAASRQQHNVCVR